MNSMFIGILISLSAYGALSFWWGSLYRKKPKKTKNSKIWLHCFNCEIEMPTIKKKGMLYCANCKLIHIPTHYSIKEVCIHPHKLTQVISAAGTCETTIEVCADCNKQLTKPKTDCA